MVQASLRLGLDIVEFWDMTSGHSIHNGVTLEYLLYRISFVLKWPLLDVYIFFIACVIVL